MQFYFIRHAQSENNALWIENGSSHGRKADPDLTPTGCLQRQYLADYLASQAGPAEQALPETGRGNRLGLTHLYSSLMLRAVKTGIRVARALDLPLTAWLDLHETGGLYLEDPPGSGTFVGQAGYNRAFFKEHFPELVLPEALNDKGWWNRPFEWDEERPQRAERVLETLLVRHKAEDRVAVISHGGFYNQFLRAILRMPPEHELWFEINNTGITRIDFNGDWITVIYHNRVDFLPPELVT